MAIAQPPPFGDLLRRHRLAAGLTQAELAERARLSANAMSALESGARRSPRKDTVALLAQALGLSAPERARFEAAARQRRALEAPTSSPASLLHASSSPSSPLVGRAAELALLARHLAGEGPPVLLLAGEPGIGKTRLLFEAANCAQEQGWTVIASGCHRRSGQEPYAPFVGALTRCIAARSRAHQRRDLQGCAWLVRLLPELAEMAVVPVPAWQLSPEQERRLMFAAVGRYLANVAGPAGTLLLLDDLQWAGPDALDLLAFLVRESAARPLRVIAAHRDTEVGASGPLATLSADLAREALATPIELGPLAHHEAADLLRHLLAGDESPEMVGRVLDRSGGVPFFLVSCARGVRAGALNGHAVEQVPWDVTQSIRQRVAALLAAAQELLGVAAVVGRVIECTLLAAVTERCEEDVLGALEALCKARLLLEQGGDAYRFAHDLIREVVEADLSATRRRLMHRRVAEAMERGWEQHPPQILADHYERGGENEKARHYLERAAEAALQVGAFAEVRRSLQRAIALAPEADQVHLYELLGDSMLGIYGDTAAAAYQAALDHWRRQGALDPLTGARLGRKQLILFFRGPAGVTAWPSPAAQEQMASEARRLAEAAGDEDERWQVRVAVLCWMAWRGDMTEEEVEEGRAVSLAAAAHFEARGDWDAFSGALDAYAGLSMAIGAHSAALAALRRRLSAPRLSAIEQSDALNMMAAAYFEMGDYDHCIATIREELAHPRPGHVVGHLAMGLNRAAEAAWLTGRWAELDRFMDTLTNVPTDQAKSAVGVYWVGLHVALAREDQVAAAAAAALMERGSSGRPNWAIGAERALLNAYRQDNPDALDLDPAHFGYLSFWALMFLSERGVPAPGPFLDRASARARAQENRSPSARCPHRGGAGRGRSCAPGPGD